MNLAIAMTTAPRPVDTLRQAIASMRAAGFDEDIHVMADTGRVGVPWHWYRTLAALLQSTTAPWLLMLQDDVTFARRSREALDALEPALTPFWTAYTDRLVAQPYIDAMGAPLPPGRYLSEAGHQSGGALAYGLSRDFAARLIEDAEFQKNCRIWTRGIDRLVPATALRLGEPLMFMVPSIVSHRLGSANSSMRPKAPRDTPYPVDVAPVEQWRLIGEFHRGRP